VCADQKSPQKDPIRNGYSPFNSYPSLTQINFSGYKVTFIPLWPTADFLLLVHMTTTLQICNEEVCHREHSQGVCTPSKSDF